MLNSLVSFSANRYTVWYSYHLASHTAHNGLVTWCLIALYRPAWGRGWRDARGKL